MFYYVCKILNNNQTINDQSHCRYNLKSCWNSVEINSNLHSLKSEMLKFQLTKRDTKTGCFDVVQVWNSAIQFYMV